jgi:formylglycine-generating enzyme required for sulfatase activity
MKGHDIWCKSRRQIGKTEETGQQWQAVIRSDASAFRGEDFPVEKVTFGQVLEFLNKLNARSEGFLYRLPTEAEWEYAARVGATDNMRRSCATWLGINDGGGAAIRTGSRRNEDSPLGAG